MKKRKASSAKRVLKRAAEVAEREFIACFRAHLRSAEEIDRVHCILSHLEAKQDRRMLEIARLHRRAHEAARKARAR